MKESKDMGCMLKPYHTIIKEIEALTIEAIRHRIILHAVSPEYCGYLSTLVDNLIQDCIDELRTGRYWVEEK